MAILGYVRFPRKVDAMISKPGTVSLWEELTMKKIRRTYVAEFKREAASCYAVNQ